MSSIFTKIISGEIPSNIVFENAKVAAFLDINPLTPGHTLVVPKVEQDNWETLDPKLFAEMNRVAQLVGKAIKIVYQPARVGLVIAGFEVPHTHIHVFGANSMEDFDFSKAKTDVSPAELAQTGTDLSTALKNLT